MNETTKDQGLGIATTQKRGEVAISAMAAKAKAEVEAKYVIALNNPRKIMEARSAILDACKRPRFAEAARYKKPVGKKQINGRWEPAFIEGLSIRFAETAIQAMKNITVESTTIWEDDEKRTVHIAVVDLESNLSYGEDVTVAKTVERKKLKEGQEALAKRKNSYGDEVFIVEATDDEVANKVAAQRSKVIRNCGLRLIPSDILEEAEDAILETLEKGGSDPKAEFKKIADSFNALGIKPGELEKYLGHSLDTVTKKELNDLRAVYTAVNSGEASWNDYVADASVPKAEAAPGPKPPPVEALRKAKDAAPAKVANPSKPPEQVAAEKAQTEQQKPANITNETQRVPQPDGKIIDVTSQVQQPVNPTQAAVTPTASPAATLPQPSSDAGVKSAEAQTSSGTEIPPSKLPEGWTREVVFDDQKSTIAAIERFLTTEDLSPDELIKWCRGRNLLKADEGLEALSPAKRSAILKKHEMIRVEIIKARG